MTINAITGDQKIPKPNRKNKEPKWSLLGPAPLAVAALLSVAFFFPTGLEALALPVSVAWDVEVQTGEVFLLEIATDPSFGHVVLSSKVSGKGFDWEAPEEGVFHWRLRRLHGDPKQSVFISGTFAVLDRGAEFLGGTEKTSPARLTWDAVAGADRYKLYVLEEGGNKRSMITTATTFLVPRTEGAQMVEVVPLARRLANPLLVQSIHFNPSLRLVGRSASAASSLPGAASQTPTKIIKKIEPVIEKQAGHRQASPVTIKKPAPLVPIDQASVASLKTAKQKTSQANTKPKDTGEPPPAVVETASSQRMMEIVTSRQRYVMQSYLFYVDESLRAQKLDIDLKSQAHAVGAGVNWWAQPFSGFVLSGAAFYHEHRGEVDAASLGAETAYKLDEPRFTGELGFGWDLLEGLDLPRHRLAATLLLAYVRVPRLPLVFDGSPGATPDLEQETLNLIGGGLSYSLFFTRVALVLEAGMMVDTEEEAQLDIGRLSTRYRLSKTFSVNGGLFFRRTEVTRCHSNAEICLREGDVVSTVDESGVFLGFGLGFGD
jgi:hypothetical protein